MMTQINSLWGVGVGGGGGVRGKERWEESW